MVIVRNISFTELLAIITCSPASSPFKRGIDIEQNYVRLELGYCIGQIDSIVDDVNYGEFGL